MEKQKEIEKQIFTVPEGYFEQLNKEILSATTERCTITPRRKSYTLGRLGRVAGYAAAIALFFAIASNIFAPGSKANENNASAYVAESEYIDNILDSYTIDDYTFYCYLTDSDIE